MRRVLVAALVCALLFATGRPSVAAAPTCAISLVDPTPAVGAIVMVNGANLPATPSPVEIFIDVAPGATRLVGRAFVTAEGSFAEPIRIPADIEVGAHTVSASCGSATIDVVRPVSAQVGDDDDAAPIAVAGVSAVVIALVLTTRRRRTQRILL